MTGDATEPECRVRPFHPEDSAAAEALFARCPEAGQWAAGSYTRLEQEGCRSWVAELGRNLVGMIVVRCAADEMEILNLGVGPGLRRKRIARQLVETALPAGREAGAGRVFLEVRASNTAARAFYESIGFTLVGRRPRYYFSPVEDALILHRTLA